MAVKARRAIALTSGALLFAIGAAFYILGWTLSKPVPAHIGLAPASLQAEAIAFRSESGGEIHGWISPLRSARAVILLLPGVRANRLSMVRRAEFLRQSGYATMLIDFQATGESTGNAITFGWRERFDVLAAMRYLRMRMPDLPVAIVGVSLGGAATLLATPPLEVQAAVLESVYPSVDRALVNRLRMRIGPLAPALAPLLAMQLRPRLGVAAADLRPADHVAYLNCPVLIIGSTRDQHTTVDDTQLLFAAARAPKELWVIPEAPHIDYLEFAPDAYRARILAFLTASLR